METENSKKKSIFKKWWFWLIVVFIIIIIAATSSPTNTNESHASKSKVEVIIADFSTMTRDETESWLKSHNLSWKITDEYSTEIPKGNFIKQSLQSETVAHEGDKITVNYSLGKEPTIEEKNALKKAESYSKNMHMSKKSIYNQLTSEYGEKFTEAAAQYAIDNLEADCNANALAKAKSYQTNMNMSKQRIYDQLISEYGEKFTKEEAQYAIDHLDD